MTLNKEQYWTIWTMNDYTRIQRTKEGNKGLNRSMQEYKGLSRTIETKHDNIQHYKG